jgi:photosystem II stability/assembly factor-like uncharacterized protein
MIMKKTVTLCIAVLAALTLSAQWSPVYSDSSKIYHDADFPTALDGFVIGENINDGSRFILRTADGGVSWTEIALPTGFFNQIAMYSATSGYVSSGGSSGILLHTSNAFATTTSNLLDGSFTTTGLEVISDSSGFYMNNSSRFRSFDNYGSNITILMDTLTGTGAFDVADDTTIYVSNGTRLLKSTDAGATWFCVNSNLSAYIGLSLVFINADTGYYLYGSGQGVWRTVDGGVSFQMVDNYYGAFLDARGSCCAAIFGLGTIRWSSDYGQNWALESLGMFNSHGVYLTPLGDCYVTNNNTGEIRKRQIPLTVAATVSAPKSVSVFPNPANDRITVSLADESMDAGTRVVLLNSLGEAMREAVLSRDGSVSLIGLAPGIYYCQVWTSDELVATELISKY